MHQKNPMTIYSAPTGATIIIWLNVVALPCSEYYWENWLRKPVYYMKMAATYLWEHYPQTTLYSGGGGGRKWGRKRSGFWDNYILFNQLFKYHLFDLIDWPCNIVCIYIYVKYIKIIWGNVCVPKPNTACKLKTKYWWCISLTTRAVPPLQQNQGHQTSHNYMYVALPWLASQPASQYELSFTQWTFYVSSSVG